MRSGASAQTMTTQGRGVTTHERGTGFLGMERPTGAMRVVYEVVRILLVVAAIAGAAQPFMHRAGLQSPFELTLR
jgi:hypothetical protein